MPDLWKMRRKCHVKIIPDRIGLELLALPEEIMVVCDGRHTGFNNDLGDSNTQRNVERDGKRIFGNQEIDLEFVDKIV